MHLRGDEAVEKPLEEANLTDGGPSRNINLRQLTRTRFSKAAVPGCGDVSYRNKYGRRCFLVLS